jgi:hypothetical protein
MKIVTTFALTVMVLVASVAFAKDATRTDPFRVALVAVPAAELPAKAADLVLDTKRQERAKETVGIVRAAVGINPAAAPAIVGAIARTEAEMAPIAAGTAAAEQPKQAAAIATAAAAAAPSQVGKIVMAVCRAVPGDYGVIAAAVAKAVPNAGKEIVKAIESARPDLESYIEQALVSYGGKVYSVRGVLDQSARLAQNDLMAGRAPTTALSPSSSVSALTAPQPATTSITTGTIPAPLARGPAVGPPYIPLHITATNVTSGGSGDVPSGGRNYATP